MSEAFPTDSRSLPGEQNAGLQQVPVKGWIE
jgi:hypothetical protein